MAAKDGELIVVPPPVKRQCYDLAAAEWGPDDAVVISVTSVAIGPGGARYSAREEVYEGVITVTAGGSSRMLEFRDLAQNDDKGITDGDVRDDEVDAGAVPADDGDDAEDGPEPAPTDYTKLIDEIVFVARVKDLYTPSDAHLSGPRVYGPLPIRVKLVEWDSAGRFSRVTSALEVLGKFANLVPVWGPVASAGLDLTAGSVELASSLIDNDLELSDTRLLLLKGESPTTKLPVSFNVSSREGDKGATIEFGARIMKASASLPAPNAKGLRRVMLLLTIEQVNIEELQKQYEESTRTASTFKRGFRAIGSVFSRKLRKKRRRERDARIQAAKDFSDKVESVEVASGKELIIQASGNVGKKVKGELASIVIPLTSDDHANLLAGPQKKVHIVAQGDTAHAFGTAKVSMSVATTKQRKELFANSLNLASKAAGLGTAVSELRGEEDDTLSTISTAVNLLSESADDVAAAFGTSTDSKRLRALSGMWLVPVCGPTDAAVLPKILRIGENNFGFRFTFTAVIAGGSPVAGGAGGGAAGGAAAAKR